MDKQTRAAAEKFSSSFSDSIHTLTNEPSLGLYYVVEHVQRSVPALVADKRELRLSGGRLQGADVDATFALENVHATANDSTMGIFANIAQLTANAAAVAQQRSP
mmetsp:Transcript_32283/g.53359  ORF Transcript_32283/g.53359 Transcript_32283/m.53359 type:complete len:105 (+) Transcript_32283:67-381(+)|eukprot:CAMPEP_0119321582 /NCGR_PEP_ID=MMETSP1333-20130426/55821_1 /TAXON_ID=418940 /ORGANISM="Scyphosphaera apsteinii, Strain RCC1455" /LENGTH=104 /DNA_ID=CAMNT_0007328589 /DNA_START=52 /DNA_END=366 /DNA_ORIENTATION=-